MKSALALTFHRINPEPIVSYSVIDSASQRYTVSTGLFEQVINVIPAGKSCTISEYIEKQDGDWLILTFDDGFLSDFEIAFPILKDKGVKATFFINEESIGLPGYLERSHLKEMAKAGMEIGSHGLTHRYLISMGREEAKREILESKEKLEQIIDREVISFAPVGGHYRKWMKEIAFESGYKVFATMVPGRTNGGGKLTVMRRNHIQSRQNVDSVSRLIKGDSGPLIKSRLRYNALQLPKRILGIHNYDLFKNYLFSLLKTPY